MSGTTPRSGAQPRDAGWWTRRVVVLTVVAAQVGAIVAAYGAPHTPFGWQMFPAADEWRAEIVRVAADGRRVDVRDPWPGGIVWSEAVQNHGLASPFGRQPAVYGIEATLDFLAHALDWMADHTPEDGETLRLEAVVTYWENGRGPFREVLTSADREETNR